jgi:hypothetical protein
MPASPIAVRRERESFLFYDGSTNVPSMRRWGPAAYSKPVVPAYPDGPRHLRSSSSASRARSSGVNFQNFPTRGRNSDRSR